MTKRFSLTSYVIALYVCQDFVILLDFGENIQSPGVSDLQFERASWSRNRKGDPRVKDRPLILASDPRVKDRLLN